ncbi:unnamed protein product, partial [Tetraodon nigroviridis]
EDEVHSVASLKDYNYNITEQSSASIPESSIPKYTPQSAADILLYFGLEKEDLEELKSYPEDQLTPANLPFILRQIRIKKGKTPAAGRVSHKGTSSSGLQQSQVIDYGHVSRYTGSIVDDGARTSDSRSNDRGIMSLMDSFTHSRNQEGPLQKDGTLMKSASLGASHYQETSVTGQSSSYRSVLNSAIPPVRQLQPSQDGFSPYSVKKDADVGILKTESSKPAPLREPEADCQPTKTIQPTFKSSSKGHVRSTSVTGVVLFDSKNKDGKTSKKTQRSTPVLPQLMNFGPLKFTTAATKGSSAVQSSAQLPTPAMMYDYAATSPKTFPHTCSLCNTECTRMKDWISHQNTSLHLENCKYLRTRYPNWDGEITCNQRDADKDSKPSTSQHHVQSLTQQSKLEAVVKTLAPALLAELVKINPAPSTSRAKKDAVSEAVVYFEKEEDAEKLKMAKKFEVKGFEIVVCRYKAFVKMPTMESVHNLITKAKGEEKMTIKCAKISFHVLGFENPASPGVSETESLEERLLWVKFSVLKDETAKEAAPMYEIKSEEPLFDEMKVRTESASQLKPKREIEMVKEENADQKEQDDDMDLKEFNMDDFVTVDEVGADVEDTPVECEISTSTSSTSTTKRTDSARVKEEKHVESAVAKPDHKVGAECKEAEKLPVHKQEEQEDGDNYQIIDSFEEQTDEKMDKQGSSSTQPTEPGVGVDIEGKIHPEEKVGMPVHESAPGEPAASSLENIQ